MCTNYLGLPCCHTALSPQFVHYILIYVPNSKGDIRFWTDGVIFNPTNSSCRDQDLIKSDQSLRILSNLISAGAVTSRGILDEILGGVLSFISAIFRLKVSDRNDLIAKVHLFPLLVMCVFIYTTYVSCCDTC